MVCFIVLWTYWKTYTVELRKEFLYQCGLVYKLALFFVFLKHINYVAVASLSHHVVHVHLNKNILSSDFNSLIRTVIHVQILDTEG